MQACARRPLKLASARFVQFCAAQQASLSLHSQRILRKVSLTSHVIQDYLQLWLLALLVSTYRVNKHKASRLILSQTWFGQRRFLIELRL